MTLSYRIDDTGGPSLIQEDVTPQEEVSSTHTPCDEQQPIPTTQHDTDTTYDITIQANQASRHQI